MNQATFAFGKPRTLLAAVVGAAMALLMGIGGSRCAGALNIAAARAPYHRRLHRGIHSVPRDGMGRNQRRCSRMTPF
jgi:hypothetical protein